MATKNLYFRNGSNGTPATGCWTLSETIGAATEDTTTTHTGNGTNATFQLLNPGASVGATAVTTNDVTTANPNIATARRFGWFSDVSYNGTFDAGTWILQHRHDDTRTNITGAPVINVYKSTTQDFTGTMTFLFTFNTAQDWWTGTTATASGTSAAQASFQLNGEFLFVQVLCNETANTTTAQSHHFHTEGNVDANVSKIVSPDFTTVQFVQGTSVNDNGIAGTTSAKAYVSNNVAGNLLVLGILWTARTINVSVTDSQGNTWSPWAKGKQTNNNTPELSNIEIFYVPGCKVGANTVTVTYDATGAFAVWTIAEYHSTISSVWSEDQSAVSLAAVASTSPSSGATSTLTAADEAVIGVIGTIRNNEVFTAGAGFTNIASTSANTQSCFQEWKGSSTTAAQTATATLGTSSSWNAGVITFRQSAPPTTTSSPSLMMTGMGF